MKLADLIDHLIEIHNRKGVDNPTVKIMTEYGTEKVTDITFSEKIDCVIIIGNDG